MSLLLLFNHSRAYQAKTGWSISINASSQVLVTFASMGRVNADQEFFWKQYAKSGQADYAVAWTASQLSGTSSRGLEWSQEAHTTASAGVVWNTLALATSTHELTWFSGGWVFRETELRWLAIQPTGTADVQTLWTASQYAPGDPVSMVWGAGQFASSSVELPWLGYGVTTRTLQMNWLDLGYVASPLMSLVWDALVAVQGPTLALLWSADEIVQAVSQVLLWRSDGQTFSEFQTTWTSSGPAVALLQLVWDALVPVNHDELLQWKITAFVPSPYTGAMVQAAGTLEAFSRSGLLIAGTMEGVTRSMEATK